MSGSMIHKKASLKIRLGGSSIASSVFAIFVSLYPNEMYSLKYLICVTMCKICTNLKLIFRVLTLLLTNN